MLELTRPGSPGSQFFAVTVMLLTVLANRTTTACRQDTTMTRLFAPVDIGANLSLLPESERQALLHIVASARAMDSIFLQQVWAGNPSMLLALINDQSAAHDALLDFFLLNKGPWSRVENNQEFVRGAPQKPSSANFYPADATKEEVEAWFQQLEGTARTEATVFFTTIRRDRDGNFISVPYSMEYQGPLAIAAEQLRLAARATAEPTLRHYLETRATAFETQ